MSGWLKPGDVLPTDKGSTCRVTRLLGRGGQGEVYEAEWEGNRYAIKWYFPSTANAGQHAALSELVKKLPPSERFLWPLAMVGDPGRGQVGYLMPLRQPRFKGLIGMFRRVVEPSFRAVATAGLQLADSFYRLHAKGLCYCDISWGNVFLDPDTGDIAVCDNDNVVVNGTQPEVMGTPAFMAPEILRGEAIPSNDTDRFSLAVLLFLMCYVNHPLKGRKDEARCFDEIAQRNLFGVRPVYIFDPRDESNRPVPGLHDNAIAFHRVYPASLKNLFERSFTEGLRDPSHGRVTEPEWMDAMVRLRDAIHHCPRCNAENFFDPAAAGGSSCWSCCQALTGPLRIHLGREVIVLSRDTQLFPHHLDPHRRHDFATPLAAVVQNPRNPTVWGLKNLTSGPWSLTTRAGTEDLAPGRSAVLTPGNKILFGKAEGEIRYG